jgi:CheY-like chemotaxis protein
MAAGTPLRVLVVDDWSDTRDSLEMLLSAWGHEVRLARDGPSALEAARSFSPQAVLLDIGLPGGMDGWDVARRIREQDGGRAVLLVALTGHGRELDKARSREAGFDAHLTKPADPQELQHLLLGVAAVGAA